MSATLKMRPAFKGLELPDKLKLILRIGILSGGSRRVNISSLMYFEGLRDAGIDGAQDVIDAIDKHGEVELFLVE